MTSLSDEPLRCPSCGGDYLHHETIEAFSRYEDEPTVRLTRIADAVSVETVPNAGSENPSSRRDGLRVRFSCENCTGLFWLCVAQHKGQTLIEWNT